jgi:hypothetical protein
MAFVALSIRTLNNSGSCHIKLRFKALKIKTQVSYLNSPILVFLVHFFLMLEISTISGKA